MPATNPEYIACRIVQLEELPTDIAGLAMVAEGKDPKRQELGKGDTDVGQS